MEKRKKILIVGGDMRQIFCAGRLAEEFDIYTIGIDKNRFPDNIDLPAATPEMTGQFDYAVLPVTPPDERGNISASLFSGTLPVALILPLLSKNAVVFTGMNSPRLESLFFGHRIEAYMEREELSLKNAVPTAEGAVMIALEELPVTLNGLPVLIVGMGRIGTALALILKGFGADITAAVRSSESAARSRILGVPAIYTKNITGNYGLVFNTAPNLVFDNELLKKFPDDTLFIDLASRPGGFDFEEAAVLGKKVLWALGIPGKTAPVTAGIAVAETISEIISHERSKI